MAPNVVPQIRPMSTFTGSVWVEPAVPLEPRTIQLSAIDQLCAHVYPSPTFFWRLGAQDDPLTQFANLKAGLSRLMYQQPHLAGILRQNERGAFSVEIPPAPHAGTQLIYRDVSEDDGFPSFDQLEAAGFPLADGDMDGLSHFRVDPFPASEDGDPVIVQQLTHVKGGLILMSSYSHLVGDLVQGHQLGVPWAANTRAVAEASLAGKPPPLPERMAAHLLDRAPLIPKNSDPLTIKALTERADTELPDWAVLDPNDSEKLVELVSKMNPPAYIMEKDLDIEDELRVTRAGVWCFPSRSLEILKQEAVKDSAPGTKVSVIDALSAFIWQRFITAKYLPGHHEGATHLPSEIQLVFAGDTRRRLAKPLPSGYMGVCVDLFRVNLSTKELLPSSEADRGLAKACAALRRVNGQWSESKWNSLLELSWRAPFSPGLIPKGPLDLLMTDHTRAQGLTTSDWGPGLGVPVAFREPYFGRICPAGEVTMLPRKSNGDVEVMISGETVVMHRLSADPDMMRMSQNLFIMHDVVEGLKAKKVQRPKL